jgi:hypothetical protein
LKFAFFKGNPAKALNFKALAAPKGTYQQSYPQKPWIQHKRPLNQALSADFASSHQ